MKAVMFDLDGTLVFQTKEYILNTVGKTISELGLKTDENFVNDFWYCHGSNRDKIIENRLGIEYMKFWRVFWRHDVPEERVKHTGVYDDVIALGNLRKKGVKLGIVTGALTKVANAEISKILSRVKDCKFDYIVSNNPDAGIRQKPYPDTLLICLKGLKMENSNALYVGNSYEDVEAAIRAQVKPVVVLREPVRRMKYDSSVKVISSLHEIEGFI